MSKYHPKTVSRKILTELQKSNIQTPSGIAKKIGYNPKTVTKYVDMLEDLGKVECLRVPIGKREFKFCSIKRDQK